MNFLSHYYFDHKTSKPELGLGLILPDLIHQHNSSWRMKPASHENLFEGRVMDLYSGWKKHQEVDKLFHNSLYFKEKTGFFKNKIKEVFFDSPIWTFFLAHITLELCLDSLLITGKFIEIQPFYALLEKVDTTSVLHFLRINGVKNPYTFIPFYEKFIRSAYLYKYSNPEEISFPLEKICQRIWAVPFNENQKAVLKESILHFCEENKSDFQEIFFNIYSEMQPIH